MESYPLIFAFMAGLALGAFFSLSLWASVKKMVDEQTPWHVMFESYVFRTAVVLLGFFVIMAGRWERMVAALAGFVAMRVVMGRSLGRDNAREKGAAWRS